MAQVISSRCLTGLHSWLQRLGAGALVIILVVLLPRLRHWGRTTTAIWKKGKAYDRLYAHAKALYAELKNARDAVRRYASEAEPYQLEKVQVHRSQLFLVIRKKPGRPLPVGTQLRVYDTTDFSLMGIFRLQEVRRHTYQAQADGFVSPVWIGFVMGIGTPECDPPPNSAAFVVPPEEQTNDGHDSDIKETA